MKTIVVKDNHILMPPYVVEYTKEEAQLITEYWHKSGYKYIVDSLPTCQCLYIMWKEMNWYYKWLLKHKYHMKMEILKIPYKIYQELILNKKE